MNLFESKTSFFADDRFKMAWKKAIGIHSLQDFLVYDAFDEEKGLFIQDQGAGFIFEAKPIMGACEETQKELAPILQSILPIGSRFQMLLFASPFLEETIDFWSHEKDGNSIETLPFMRKKRGEFLKNCTRGDANYFPFVIRSFRSIFSVSIPIDLKDPMNLKHVSSIKEKIKTTLSMLMGTIKDFDAHDLISFLSSLLNRRHDTIHHHKKIWNPLDSIQSQIVEPDTILQVDENCVSLNDIAIQTFSVSKYPSLWALQGMLDILGDPQRDAFQIPCSFWIHYGLEIPPQDSLKSKILGKTAYVEKQVFSPLGKYLPSLQKEAQELAFVREKLDQGMRIVKTSMNVGIMAPFSMLDQANVITQGLFESQGWHLKENKYMHLPFFLSCLPLQWTKDIVLSFSRIKRLKTTLTTEAVNLFPIQGEWHGTHTPSMFLVGRRGQAFYWNPFDNDSGNYNVCVVGRSGSGKSVFMQELMTSTLSLGGRVFVMDVGRSFEKTCVLLGGQFIEFTPKVPLCLNPFTHICEDKENAHDALSMIKNVICMMASPSGEIDDIGASLIEKAILMAWDNKRNKSDLSDIARILSILNDQRSRELSQMLFPYTREGMYGRFFNGASNVNLENQLVVVELEELKERKDLQAVVVQMLVIEITNQMFLKRGSIPFHIVFDEAWDLMKHKQTGRFIETLARRLRKYQGSLVVGTQSVHDFFQIPGAQAAFENSDWLVLLSQKKESVDQLKASKRLSMSVHMEEQIKSLKTKHGLYAEAMISGPNGYAIGRLLLDPYSRLLYSTKSEDYMAIKTMMNKNITVKDAILYHLDQQERGFNHAS